MALKNRTVTMHHVAKAAGVSISTVSLALNNSPKITLAKRQLVSRIAKKLGYRPDPRIIELMKHLRTPAQNRTHATIAVLIPEIPHEKLPDYPRLVQMLSGIKGVGNSMGFNIDIFHLAAPNMTLSRIRQILIARNIKGIVVAPFISGVAELDFDFTGFSASTIGYSIVKPRLNRACPDYQQMMDELLTNVSLYGYKRPGLAMSYLEGGVGHKLFKSSFLYHQSKLPPQDRIPILPSADITPTQLQTWIHRYQPDVIISSGVGYHILTSLGYHIPRDIGFASIDVSDTPDKINISGADHRHQLVGEEAMKIVLSSLSMNITGIPNYPKTVLADSHQHMGTTLTPQTPAAKKHFSRKKEVL